MVCGAFAVLTSALQTSEWSSSYWFGWLIWYVSLGLTLVALTLTPLVHATALLSPVVVAALVVAILVVLRHASKVRRLTGGAHRRLGEGWA
jgi:glycerol-3-phosphate acyltransferase PlsY